MPEFAGYLDPYAEESTRGQRLTVEDLSWQEVADAVWLANLDAGDGAAAADPPVRAATLDLPKPAFEPLTEAAPTRAAPVRRFHRRGDLRHEGWPADAVPRTAAPTLSQHPALVRALRSLRIQVPSAQTLVLDEERTAERIAEGSPLPMMFNRAKERLWDVVLVVTESPSMTLWRRTAIEFRALLERQGAFRDVKVRRARSTANDGLLLYGATDNPAPIAPGTLLDPRGRRLVLVLTDGVGPMWRSGAAHALLRLWGNAHPIVIIQVLPQRLWRHSEIRPHPARLHATTRGVPNRALRCEFMNSLEAESEFMNRALPVPVLELDPRWLGRWAGFVTCRQTQVADLPVLMIPEPPAPAPSTETAAAADPRQRVREFRDTASPEAFSLATALAATPLTIELAEEIQQTLLPQAGPGPLAEVLMSELVGPLEANQDTAIDELDRVTMDFVAGVREELLAYGKRVQTRRVQEIAGDYFRGDTAWDELRAVLENPDAPGTSVITPDVEPFLRAQHPVLRALSDRYYVRADRLAQPSTVEPTVAAELVEYETVERINGGPSPAVPETIEVAEPGWQWFSETDEFGTVAPALGWTRSDRPAVWGDVPVRSPGFVGREEIIDYLREHRGNATGAPIPITLAGMAGVGKTQLAVEYIYRHLAELDLVWWVPASTSATVRRSLMELAKVLRLPNTTEPQHAIPDVLEALRTGRPFRRWLLVFDDAGDPGQHIFLPTGGPGLIIVTSRNPIWGQVSRALEVKVFRRQESIAVLMNRTSVTEAEADQVAERLGDLPLAIDQAGTWLNHTGMPVERYLEVLDQHMVALLNAHDMSVYDIPVGAAFAVSLSALSRDNPAAARLLQLYALLPEPLPLSELYRSRHLIPRIAPELDRLFRDPIELGRAMRDIRRYSLVNFRDDHIEMHPIVRAVVLDQLGPWERQNILMAVQAMLEQPPRNDDQS